MSNLCELYETCYCLLNNTTYYLYSPLFVLFNLQVDVIAVTSTWYSLFNCNYKTTTFSEVAMDLLYLVTLLIALVMMYLLIMKFNSVFISTYYIIRQSNISGNTITEQNTCTVTSGTTAFTINLQTHTMTFLVSVNHVWD